MATGALSLRLPGSSPLPVPDPKTPGPVADPWQPPGRLWRRL